MPKRDVQIIAHAVLTNHRIVAQAEEPYPDAAFHMTTPQMPDLVQLSSIPGKRDEPASPLILLQAYGQLMTPNPQYRERYFALAKRLEAADSNNVDVLRALAALAMEQKNDQATVRYLDAAVKEGATSPEIYEQLASLLIKMGRYQEAADALERGIKQMPYDAMLYRLLGSSYLSLRKNSESHRTVAASSASFSAGCGLAKTSEGFRRNGSNRNARRATLAHRSASVSSRSAAIQERTERIFRSISRAGGS